MIEHTCLPLSMGSQGLALGQLEHFQGEGSAYSTFSYAPAWLERPKPFAVSPDLPLLPGPHIHKPSCPGGPSVFLALADTAPGPWGRRVIEFVHKNLRESVTRRPPLDELQYLRAVNNAQRWGAIRLGGAQPLPWWAHTPDKPATLEHLMQAIVSSWVLSSRGLLQADLKFFMENSTSMGGAWPKACLVDQVGHLVVAKLPAMDDRTTTLRLELLALKMAESAGIKVPPARFERANTYTVLLIQRFDRNSKCGRKACISARTMLGPRKNEVLGYLDVLHAMRFFCSDFHRDAQQLWRRLAFYWLIGHTDKDLQRIHFVYEGSEQWRLAPAVGISPHPTHLTQPGVPMSARLGKVSSIQMLVENAPAFGFSPDQARFALAQVVNAIRKWHSTAQAHSIFFGREELETVKPLFVNTRLEQAIRLCS